MQFIDIGANLTHRQFEKDREQVIKRAAEAGVVKILVTGTSVKESRRAAELAAKYPGQLYATAGVHPHDAKTWTPDTETSLRKLAALPQVTAIGECGLDFDRNFSPQDIQKECFEAQLVLAEELHLPLFLHERAAFRVFAALLEKHSSVCKRAVVHCFTGTEEEIEAYLSMGVFIGITGWICDERRSAPLRRAIKKIPLDRMMIETDAPFLMPRNRGELPPGRRNEPAFLPYVGKEIASILKLEEKEFADAVYENTVRFFHL